MRRFQPGDDIAGDAETIAHRYRAGLPQDRRQIHPLDIRHRDVLDAVDLAEVVNADDVLVRHLPSEQKFLLESSLQLSARAVFGVHLRSDDLERDGHAQLGIPSLIDGAHSSDPQEADYVIPRA